MVKKQKDRVVFASTFSMIHLILRCFLIKYAGESRKEHRWKIVDDLDTFEVYWNNRWWRELINAKNSHVRFIGGFAHGINEQTQALCFIAGAKPQFFTVEN